MAKTYGSVDELPSVFHELTELSGLRGNPREVTKVVDMTDSIRHPFGHIALLFCDFRETDKPTKKLIDLIVYYDGGGSAMDSVSKEGLEVLIESGATDVGIGGNLTERAVASWGEHWRMTDGEVIALFAAAVNSVPGDEF